MCHFINSKVLDLKFGFNNYVIYKKFYQKMYGIQ